MQKLFENWRKYITEVDTDNDGIDDERELAIIDKGEIEPQEQETSDEQKIFNAFLDNGAHGLHLAEMTDSPITKDLKEIVDRVHNHISFIESVIEGNVPGHTDDKPQTMYKTVEEFIGHRLEGYAEYTGELLKKISVRVQLQDTRNFTEMLLEAGDYVWWTGAFKDRSSMWSYNVASPESSSAMLNDLKEWAGV